MTDANHPYRFKAQFGENTRHLDFVIKDGKPVKLGDGTFGCVFHVRDPNQRSYALKIFYKSNDEFILASQEKEMKIGDDLRAKYIDCDDKLNNIERYLVLAQGSVEKFTESDAYKSLKDYFNQFSFRISNNAIVMNHYPMSLKDLLEKDDTDSPPPQNSNATIGRGSGHFGPTSGYSILEKLRQEERENSLLPFAQDIAKALSLLHDAGVNHQDIKPANVMVRTVGNNIESALADLGFIIRDKNDAHGSTYQNHPLGTRHYRAPEQMDSFDICEVDIQKHANGYELKTRDPKFRQTFSEEGDFVVFSKFEKKFQWEIEKITPDKGTIHVKKLPEIQLAEDKKTQVTIHKKQTARTDLFGLGAIMYDMLTCGRSPERFYDLLRVHDRDDGSIKEGLARKYSNFSNGGGTVPEIDLIFQNLKTKPESEYPNPEIVKIILKCMMSQPKDSYFIHKDKKDNKDNKDKKEAQWNKVLEDISNIMDNLKSREYSEWNRNPLTSGKAFQEYQGEPVTERDPLKQLREIQKLSYKKPDDFVRRIVQGVRFLERIFHMVEKESGNGQLYFFSNISPQNLKERRMDFEPKVPFFEKEEDLNSALTSDNPKALLQVFSTSSLRPPFMETLVRECKIWTAGKKEDPNGDITFKFDLWEAEFGHHGIEKGDHLIIEIAPTIRLNKEITNVHGGCLSIKGGDPEIQKMNTERPRTETEGPRTYIVKKIKPLDYYISMLGIYIRLIFFVDSADWHEHVPQAIYYFEQGRSIGVLKLPARSTRWTHLKSLFRKLCMVGKSQALFHDLAYLYVRFVTRDLKNPEAIHEVLNELTKTIADLFNYEQDKLVRRNLSEDQENNLVEEIQRKNSSLSVKTFPDIDKLLKDIVLSCKS